MNNLMLIYLNFYKKCTPLEKQNNLTQKEIETFGKY